MTNETPVYALTFHRPWAAAVAYGTKRTENRTWAPKNPPDRIAIHAGNTIDRAGERRLAAHCGGEVPDEGYHQGLIGHAALTGTHPADACPGDDSCLLWGTSSGHHWVLADVHLLEHPVPATGHQRLWRLAPEQARALNGAAPVPDPTRDLAAEASSRQLVAALRNR